MKHKNKFLLFINACIPGCGQMYQGYMKRGLSLMLALCTLFAFSLMLRLDYLIFFAAPLWLYAFFDSWNIFHQEESTLPDEWLFGLSTVDSQKLSALLHRRGSIIGWGLIVLGCYVLFETVVGRILQAVCQMLEQWWIYDMVMRDFPRLLVTIAIIALGVWFIRGPKRSINEDIPAFTPPAEKEVPHGEE